MHLDEENTNDFHQQPFWADVAPSRNCYHHLEINASRTLTSGKSISVNLLLYPAQQGNCTVGPTCCYCKCREYVKSLTKEICKTMIVASPVDLSSSIPIEYPLVNP